MTWYKDKNARHGAIVAFVILALASPIIAMAVLGWFKMWKDILN